jgi:pyruvate/2-oxoglutarate/acetoin dehydrogenase E1 component
MSAGARDVPVTIRAIGGGSGNFGTQHSATGESWFIGLPGLRVATAHSPSAAYGILRTAIRDHNPVLMYEHKGLYSRRSLVNRSEAGIVDIGKAECHRIGADITIVGTMLMVDRALVAADLLATEGIDVEVIDLRWLRPLDVSTVAKSVSKTRRLLVVEEQVHNGGWGATIISVLTAAGVDWAAPPQAISLPDRHPIPFAPSLEDAIIPTAEAIASAVRRLA